MVHNSNNNNFICGGISLFFHQSFVRETGKNFYFFAFDRTHTIYVVFQSRGFYDVPRVLIADARSFQGFAAVLD